MASNSIKKVLVVRYSQTGQLTALADRIIEPLLADARFSVTLLPLVPRQPFPFPWTFFKFLDAFPESAHMLPPALATLQLTGDEDFDLVLLPYQVWFLAPSQPIVAFLKHPTAQRVLRGKPVITLVACRNMWLCAQEKLEGLLRDTGARLIDNVVLTDPGPTLATFITTPRWLLTGKKQGFWGLPAAGLSAAQIHGARRFGQALHEALLEDREKGSLPLLAGLGAVRVEPRLYFSERTGTRSFFLWGKLLMSAGPPGSWQRRPLLALYVLFLVVMIATLVPASLALQALLRPWLQPWLSRIEGRFEAPSGSSMERSHLYED